MLYIGLLLAIVLLLVAGIALGNSAILMVALLVTGLAGFVVFGSRGRSRRKQTQASQALPGSADAQAGGLLDEAAGLPGAAPADGAFAQALATAARPAGLDSGLVTGPVAVSAQAEVWVVDGEPEFHVRRCRVLSAAAEPIPYAQAIEDGFTPCPECDPRNALLAEAVSKAVVAPADLPSDLPDAAATPELVALAGEPGQISPQIPPDTQVWVLDGHPDFHVPGCPHLVAAAEPIDFAQAIEDGFTPCARCQPLTALRAAAQGPVHLGNAQSPVAAASDETSNETAAPDALGTVTTTAEPTTAGAADTPVGAGGGLDGSLAEVWVMDGAPDYHLPVCPLLDDNAEPVPYAQALADGFSPCGFCEPELSTAFVPGAAPSPAPAFADAIAIEQVPAGSLAQLHDHAQPEPSEELPANDSGAQVWVVDGRPAYHAADCPLLGAAAQPLPREVAIEDGFTPCALCHGGAAQAAGDVLADDLPPAGLAQDDLPQAAGHGVATSTDSAVAAIAETTDSAVAEAAQVDQPVPERFQADAVSPQAVSPEPAAITESAATAELETAEPETAEPATAGPVEPSAVELSTAEPSLEPAVAVPVAVDGDVWVVDGRPRYHREDCLLLKNHPAVPISREQAVDAGFSPCALCAPQAAGPDEPSELSSGWLFGI